MGLARALAEYTCWLNTLAEYTPNKSKNKSYQCRRSKEGLTDGWIDRYRRYRSRKKYRRTDWWIDRMYQSRKKYTRTDWWLDRMIQCRLEPCCIASCCFLGSPYNVSAGHRKNVKGGMAIFSDTISGQLAAPTLSSWHVLASEPVNNRRLRKRVDWSSQAFLTIINSVWRSVTSHVSVSGEGPPSLKSYGDWWFATGAGVGNWEHLVNSVHIRRLGCDGRLL